jgi:hypothetical protein
MRKHKALTWKRAWIWSVSDIIQQLDLGPLSQDERVCEVKTTTTWKDPSTGKTKFQGNRHLKGTQYPDYISGFVSALIKFEKIEFILMAFPFN